MPEVVTESFCERCGTRYTFETAAKRVRLRGLKVMSRGLKTFVLDDKTSFEEAIQAARSDTDRDATSSQLDAFHQTFNFCMQCRQYTCPNCWNEAEGRCLTCAPLALGASDAPFTGVDHAPGLAAAELAAASAAAAPTNGQGANGHTHDDEDDSGFLARLDAMTRLTPVAEPEAIDAPVVDDPLVEAPEEPVAAVLAEEPADAVAEAEPEPVVEPPVAEPVATGDAADQAAAAAAAQTSALFQSRRPVLDAAMVAPVAATVPEPEPVAETLVEAEPEPEAVVAEPEPVVAEAVVAAAVIAEPEPEPETPSFLREAIAAAAIRAHGEPASQPEPEPVEAVAEPEPEPEPIAAVAEPEPEPIAAVVEPEPEPVAAEPDPAATIAAVAATDVVTQPTWSIHAPDPSAPVDDVALPAAATATPEWPDQPEWPAQQTSPGLPFLNRPAVPTGGVEALWAESDRAVTAAPGPNKASAGVQPCTSCGLSLSASARFCRRCGTAQG
jgi:nicotinate-nucleotide--dimethylbenzimidazole phosphoribosyltransferase